VILVVRCGAQSSLYSDVLNRSQRSERRGTSILVSFVSFCRTAAVRFTDRRRSLFMYFSCLAVRFARHRGIAGASMGKWSR
jgi:hypothetical protein